MTTPNRFLQCENQDAARSLWRQEANRVHPDKHPASESEQWTEEFKKLNAEYADFCAMDARQQAYARQAEAHQQGKKAQADYNDIDSLYEQWKTVIEAALNLGVDVELIGLWVWVTGPNTYAQREELKKLGFKWAHKKENPTAYFNDMGVKSFSRGGYSLEEIRGMHGSTSFKKPSARKEEEETAPTGLPATV